MDVGNGFKIHSFIDMDMVAEYGGFVQHHRSGYDRCFPSSFSVPHFVIP